MTVRRILCVVAVAAAGLADAKPAAAQFGWLTQAGEAVREQLGTDRPRVFRRSIELDDASLETLQTRLGWFGLPIPLELRGDVTARLGVEIDLSSPRDARSYRINGSLSSERLVVEGLDLRDLAASVRYVDGRLTLEQLVVTVPDPRPGAPAGRAAGDATLQVNPVGGLTANLRLSGVPMEQFARRIEAAESLLGGRLTGRLRVEAPLSNLRDIGTWRGTGQLTLVDLTAAGREVSQVETRLGLASGMLTLSDLDATIEGEEVAGSGTLNLAAPFQYEASLAVPEGELSRLDALLERDLPRWAGAYDLTARATGTLRPFAVDAAGTLAGTDWSVGGTPVESFRAAVRSDGETVRLLELTAEVLNGRLTGDAVAGLTGERGFSFRLRPERFDLAAIDPVLNVAMRETDGAYTAAYRQGTAGADERANEAAPAPLTPGPSPQGEGNEGPEGATPPAAAGGLRGTTTGEIEGQGQALPFELDALNGTLTFENLVVAGVTFDRAEVAAATENRTLVLSRLLLARGNGTLTGEGRLGLDPPGAFTATLRSERFSIDEARPLFGEGGIAGIELPPIAGTVDGEVTAAGESQPFELDSLQGNLAGDDLRIGRLLVDRFEIAAATENGTVTVPNFLLAIEDGRLTGRASLGLEGERPFEATLRPESFRVELLRPLFGEGGLIETDFPPVAGRVTGDMTLRGRAAPVEVNEVSGRVSATDVAAFGVPFESIGFAVASENGVARVTDFRAVTGFGRLGGSGTVGLSAPHDYAADLRFDDFDLSAVGRITAGITEEQRPDIGSPAEVAEGPGVLPVELEGLADLTGTVRGTFSPFVLAGEGRAASDELVLDARELSGAFRRTTLAAPSFGWRYNENRLTLSDIAAGLGGGTLSGTAAVPLGDAAGGALDLRIDAVELSDLLKLPAGLGGEASGEIAATLGPADEGGDRPTSGRASLSIPSLRAGRVAVGDVTAVVDLNRDLIGYDVNGRLFDGALATRGTWPIDDSGRNEARGTFRWTGANLARAAAVASDGSRIAGRLDAAVDYDLSAATKATGNVEVSDVRNGRELITDRLRAGVVWTDNVIRVENAAGGYAGGTVSFAVLLNASDPSRGTAEVLLRRADANRAFGWIPGLEPLTGTADLRLRGNLGSLWRWQGEGEVTRGTYGPIGFSSWRVPLDIDANPLRGAMRIDARRTALRAARGRGVLNLSVELGTSPRLDLDATFDRLDAAQLLDGLGERAPGGRISGRAELSSRNLRSLADLNGTVVATLEGSQAQNLPIVGSVVDVVRLPTGGGGTVDRGELRVFLRRGVARVEELTLSGPNFRLFAEGTVALASQRLALDVVVDTSPSRADRILAGLLLRQFVDYATPVGWIERANRLIAERAVYLRVNGTVRRPNVRIRPAEQLRQEAVRFFLNELAAPVGGDALAPQP